jgi:CDP-diacylglycerol--glycerol-3-phosphate 3-phosphatidyltransferase
MPYDERIAARQPSRIVPKWLIYYLLWAIGPVERALIRSRTSPNLLSFCGLAVSTLAGVLIGAGYFDMGGWAYLFVGILDIFDGRVARATGRATSAGAYYDSVVDRYAEFAVFAGLISYYRDSWLIYVALAALLGSFMVSYNRARAEALGDADDGKVGMMQRPERIFLLGVALAASPFVQAAMYEPTPHPEYWLAGAALLFLAVTANITALRRFWAVFRHLGRPTTAKPPTAEPAPPRPDPAQPSPRANAGVPTT